MPFRCRKSASEHNVYVTFVCMDNTLPNTPFNKFSEGRSVENDHEMEDDDDSESIRVEKSQALHDLVDKDKNNQTVLTCDIAEVDKNVLHETVIRIDTNKNENYEEISSSYKNPNILKLTKMKWLTEHDSTADSSSDSSSLTTLSSCSLEDAQPLNINDKHLSTILKIDKEQNLFGLSYITTDLPQPSFNKPKNPEKPVFPTTAIIQVCCASKCCKHQSRTDYPVSLRCGSCSVGCESCCIEASCKPCCKTIYRCNPCGPTNRCRSACIERGGKCKSFKCRTDDEGIYGLTISVNKRPKYDPEPILITPKASCILTKPLAARACTHCPPCRPPSSCFPYLMPCFWPARVSAPCSAPKCFHNPRCRPRCPEIPKKYLCPTDKKCTDTNKSCNNSSCAMYGKMLKSEVKQPEKENSETDPKKNDKNKPKKKTSKSSDISSKS